MKSRKDTGLFPWANTIPCSKETSRSKNAPARTVSWFGYRSTGFALAGTTETNLSRSLITVTSDAKSTTERASSQFIGTHHRAWSFLHFRIAPLLSSRRSEITTHQLDEIFPTAQKYGRRKRQKNTTAIAIFPGIFGGPHGFSWYATITSFCLVVWLRSGFCRAT